MFVCLFVCLYVCLSVCLLVCMHECLFGFLLVCLYVCMFVCMYVYLFVCMFVCLFVCLFAVCLFVCIFICSFVCLFVCLFVCMYVCCMFICLFVCLYVCLFVLSSSIQTHCLSAFHAYTCLSAVTPDKHNTNQDTKSQIPTCHINLYPHCCTRPSLTIAGIALVHTIIRISDIPDHEVRYHINWPSIKTLSHVVHVN